MYKFLLFLIPIYSIAQINKVPNDNIGEHIGLHIIYFLGRENGGVSLSKLPSINGVEFHQLIWSNFDYDKEKERTILTFKSSINERDDLFEVFKEVIKTRKGKSFKINNKFITIKPSEGEDKVVFIYELDKYFHIGKVGVYDLFGKNIEY
ncbi:hypothetical protein OAB12_01260 [Flavobacteriaceae bacterium]|nr:hypothetical protein [Flavobacteriaceae bacterium]